MKKKHPQPLTPAALYARVSPPGGPAGRRSVRVRPAEGAQGLREGQRLLRGPRVRGRVANRPQFREMIEEGSKPKAPFEVILAPTLASMLRWHVDHWDLLRLFLRRRTFAKGLGSVRQARHHRPSPSSICPSASCRIVTGSTELSGFWQPHGSRVLSQSRAPTGWAHLGGTRRESRSGRPYRRRLDVPGSTTNRRQPRETSQGAGWQN